MQMKPLAAAALVLLTGACAVHQAEEPTLSGPSDLGLAANMTATPGWLADNGLEWIFRLAIEPQRMWRRYLLGNPVFVSRVAAQARARRVTQP